MIPWLRSRFVGALTQLDQRQVIPALRNPKPPSILWSGYSNRQTVIAAAYLCVGLQSRTAKLYFPCSYITHLMTYCC